MDDAIDYKALLKKYMQMILEENGVTFVQSVGFWATKTKFSPLEEAALDNMHDEVCDE